jgi:hypothetical protein
MGFESVRCSVRRHYCKGRSRKGGAWPIRARRRSAAGGW